MIEKNYTKKLQSIIKQRNILFCLSLLLFALLIILIVTLTTKSKTVVLVPSNLQTEMRVSSDGTVSQSYIEQFARDVMYTALNVTPHSIAYSNKAILKITHPKLHKDLSHQFALNEKDVIRKNISSYFALHNFKFNDDNKLRVVVEGELITFIGKDLVSKEVKNYKLSFELHGTKLSLIGFKELEPKKTNYEK